MKYTVYIATSADGYIATPSGEITWLETAGDPSVDMGEDADMGFSEYISSVDCMVMGRNTMEKISSFNLSDDLWPYGDIPVYVLSSTLKDVPANLKGKMQIFNGSLTELNTMLESGGYKSCYVDGGSVITSFINQGFINSMTITRAPTLLGEGIPLFGKIERSVKLENSKAEAFSNGFIQVKYTLNYN